MAEIIHNSNMMSDLTTTIENLYINDDLLLQNYPVQRLCGTDTILSLRFLRLSDLNELKELCRKWFSTEFPKEWNQVIASIDCFFALAAICESAIVGIIITDIKAAEALNNNDSNILPASMKPRAAICYVIGILVQHTFRRRGVATYLMNSLTSLLISDDMESVKAVYLHILRSNYRAVKFYEKNNFRILTVKPNYYNIEGTAYDGLTYVLYINGGKPISNRVQYTNDQLLKAPKIHPVIRFIEFSISWLWDKVRNIWN